MISETQLSFNNKTKGRLYNEILASIGLDSLTTSQDTRYEENELRCEVQVVSTPIRNSAISLIALGKYVLTSRQGRN